MIKGTTNIFVQAKDLGYKPNGIKRYLAASDQVVEIEKKLAGGISFDDLPEDEKKILSAHEKAESAAFHAEVTEEFSQAERIAMKIAKGEKLTPEEERFIDEKYPDLKREAEQARKEGEDVKKRIKAAKTQEEKQQIAASAMQNISSQIGKGKGLEIIGAIKLAAIKQAIEEAEKEDENNKGLINHAMVKVDIEPGSFMNVRI